MGIRATFLYENYESPEGPFSTQSGPEYQSPLSHSNKDFVMGESYIQFFVCFSKHCEGLRPTKETENSNAEIQIHFCDLMQLSKSKTLSELSPMNRHIPCPPKCVYIVSIPPVAVEISISKM